MDLEDRDHFKMIGLASAARSSDRSAKDKENFHLDQASCQKRAWAICGCYRRDEAQNPEAFASALAIVLGDYPASVVDYAADPRTGIITEFPMGLPNIGQIKSFLDGVQARQDRLKRYSELPKPKPFVPKPVKAEPNLFVPMDFPRYQQMLDKHAADTENRSYFGTKTCHDGIERNGIFVPLNWWQEGADTIAPQLAAITKRVFERECLAHGIDPACGISPELLKKVGIA